MLSVLGETLFHVGGVGDGHRAKLINNTVQHGSFVVAAEALALAANVGVDQETMFDVIDSGMGSSELLRAKFGKAFENDFDATDGSPIYHARKDVKYALDMGFESDFVMHVAAAVEENYGLATAVGDGEKDYSIMLRVLENLGEDGPGNST
ncbi:MAG: NAD-binding protein [Halodesulfurarchaeum sp.]